MIHEALSRARPSHRLLSSLPNRPQCMGNLRDVAPERNPVISLGSQPAVRAQSRRALHSLTLGFAGVSVPSPGRAVPWVFRANRQTVEPFSVGLAVVFGLSDQHVILQLEILLQIAGASFFMAVYFNVIWKSMATNQIQAPSKEQEKLQAPYMPTTLSDICYPKCAEHKLASNFLTVFEYLRFEF